MWGGIEIFGCRARARRASRRANWRRADVQRFSPPSLTHHITTKDKATPYTTIMPPRRSNRYNKGKHIRYPSDDEEDQGRKRAKRSSRGEGSNLKGTQSLRHYTTQEEGDTAEASAATQSTTYDKPKRGTLQKLFIYHELVWGWLLFCHQLAHSTTGCIAARERCTFFSNNKKKTLLRRRMGIVATISLHKNDNNNVKEAIRAIRAIRNKYVQHS